MGIKDLYKVIKELAPEELKARHLSDCRGERWAVDISIFLYRYVRTAGPVRWMNIFILLLCALKRHGIKAICIFDGPNPPIEKKKEQERRRGQTQKTVNRLKECIRMRDFLQDEYLAQSEDNLKKDKREECRLLIRPRRGYKDGTNYDSVGDIVDSLNDTIDRLERQTLPITDEHRKQATKIVELLGMTAIRADGEAETLCAYLVIKGLADVILTEDTDVLAYGAPLTKEQISKIPKEKRKTVGTSGGIPMMCAFKDFKLSDEKVWSINVKEMEKKMDMNHDEFRDLCILLSCDYNERVKGYPPDGRTHKKPKGIGVVGAMAMIKEYRRLEEVCKHVVDPTPLKYRRCRELFTIPKRIKGAIVPYNKVPNYDKLSELIKNNSLTVHLDYIKNCWKPSKLKFIDDLSSSEESSESDSNEEEDSDVIVNSEESDELDFDCFIIIGAMCKNISGQTQYFTVPFKFKDVEQYEEYTTTKFMAVIILFEKFVCKSQDVIWKVIDTIMIEEEFVDPVDNACIVK